MKRPTHIQYREGRLEHQEPVFAISAWQQWNDIECSDAAAYEKDMEEVREAYEREEGMEP